MANLQFYRGDTVAIPFTFSGVDLTATTVYFTAKAQTAIAADTSDATDSDSIIKAQTSSHSDPINGKTVITLTPSQTTVTPGTYVWDVQTKDGAGNVQTRVGATLPKLVVLADVTRRTS